MSSTDKVNPDSIPVGSQTKDYENWYSQPVADPENFGGGDLKHKTSKIRMSSPKLRVIFRPKSEIQTFFSPKFRWSPKRKKKKGLHQN